MEELDCLIQRSGHEHVIFKSMESSDCLIMLENRRLVALHVKRLNMPGSKTYEKLLAVKVPSETKDRVGFLKL